MLNPISMPAEWQHPYAVLLALPHEKTDWAAFLEESHEQYRRLLKAFTESPLKVFLLVPSIEYAKRVLGQDLFDKLIAIEAEYNDTWTRDYGPIAVREKGEICALDFGFNGWGLKFAADRDNLVNLQLNRKKIIPAQKYRNQRDFELEGGSIETDGNGTLLTTSRCLCSPNRNGGKDKLALAGILSKRLGIEHFLWLDYGSLAGDDTDSHIDTLARLAPDDIILYVGCRDLDDEHFESLLKMRAQLSMFRTLEGKPFNLVELPLPDPIYDEEGNRLPATYANYLVTNDHIFIPTYGQPEKDRLAVQTIRIAFPNHIAVTVDCSVLIRQHGSLHCATMQLYEGEFI